MTQNTKKWLGAAALVLSSSVLTGAVMRTSVTRSNDNSSDDTFFGAQPTSLQMPNAAPASAPAVAGLVDLTSAAERSVNSVVYIKVTQNAVRQRVRVRDPFEDFFGDFFGYGNRGQGREQEIETQPRRQGAGSGVIITSDGYIVTNNHVVAGADEILVKLNDNTEYKGRIIGLDETTDLALVKVEAKDLPAITIGNSDDLKIGQWVLAVGNPFNLTSTVTAGIVSAKARSLGANGVESFIQTDAAINAGNSGGALVNERGELVGINAMLYSQTGSYSGYGFAIPTTIMNKVVSDLREYGTVQRALLAIVGQDVHNYIDAQKAKGIDVDLGTNDGVYVSKVEDNGAAKAAGIQEGDVIVSIDGKKVTKMAELQEILANKRPGDTVKVGILRDKSKKEMTAKLKNAQGNTDVVRTADLDVLGVNLKEISSAQKSQHNISYGLEVIKVSKGKMQEAGITKGFIITKVNDEAMKTLDDLQRVVKEASTSDEPVLIIQGLNPAGVKKYFAVQLND